MSLLYWIGLGLVAWSAGFTVVMMFMRMAGDQDRAARHEEKRRDRFSDVAVTQTGNG